ncbi:MAG: S41 family peptidase [Casimicrobiaceae bacterium]|nr:S41 family peptidase [Casimicrobiaceae bacterium]MDW8312583.1 S41 family peptidase [Burkholderiales bacterium]
MREVRRRAPRLWPVLGVVLALAGCAALDPYNVVGRALPRAEVASDAPSGEERRAQREAAVELVWRTVLERYWRADLNGVDWHAARARWAPLAIAAQTDEAFWELLDRMTGELGDSHTRVESPTAVALRRAEQARGLGLSLRELEGELIVTSVHAESDAWWAGIRPGMRIEAIEEQDALTLWRRWLEQARPVSSPQAALRQPIRALNRLAEGSDGGVRLRVERQDGSRFDVRLRVGTFSTRAVALGRTLPSGFGYVRFSAFRESIRARVLELIREQSATPGLVLDLRGNGGGSAAMVDAIAGAFFRERTLIARTQTRTGAPVTVIGVPIMPPERYAPGDPQAFTGPVAVLIDHGTASAAEALAAALQATGRARVFGETSCGCLLAFLGYVRLPGGGELAYSEIGYTDAQGRLIEGRGIVPDVPIAITRAALREGRDRVLEAAVAWLEQQRPLSGR